MGTGNQLARRDLKRDVRALGRVSLVLQKRSRREGPHDAQLLLKTEVPPGKREKAGRTRMPLPPPGRWRGVLESGMTVI